MRSWLSPLLAGALFGTGLIVSGMSRPSKVIGFLDFAGDWDPSLAFVMLGGLAVYGALQSRVRRWPHPLLAPRFLVPTRRDIDLRLITGSALFGVGWGLAGYCPGPALTAVTRDGDSLLFVAAMLGGMLLFRWVPSSPASSTTQKAPNHTGTSSPSTSTPRAGLS